jgi:hypothetical protein
MVRGLGPQQSSENPLFCQSVKWMIGFIASLKTNYKECIYPFKNATSFRRKLTSNYKT